MNPGQQQDQFVQATSPKLHDCVVGIDDYALLTGKFCFRRSLYFRMWSLPRYLVQSLLSQHLSNVLGPKLLL